MRNLDVPEQKLDILGDIHGQLDALQGAGLCWGVSASGG